MSLLEISEIMGLFVNTLIVEENYSPINSEKLPQPVQMQLCKEQKMFS